MLSGVRGVVTVVRVALTGSGRSLNVPALSGSAEGMVPSWRMNIDGKRSSSCRMLGVSQASDNKVQLGRAGNNLRR